MKHKLLYYDVYFIKKLIEFKLSGYATLVAYSEIDSICTTLGIDRANYYPHPLFIDRAELPSAKNITLDECMYQRAREISSIKGKKQIMWSGGIDSTAALIALMMHDNEFDYKIICTKSSIKEYPFFYNKYVSKMNHEIRTDKINDLFDEIFADTVITGYGADPITCNYTLVKDKNLPLNYPWGKLMDMIHQEKNIAFDILTSHVKNSPVPIKTVDDMYWWLNFLFDWHADLYKIGLCLKNSSNIKNHVPFFGNDMFQSWALYNYDNIKIHSWDNLKNHKKYFKDYVYKFTKDDVYYNNKQKENSIELEYGPKSMKHRHRCLYSNYYAPKFFEFVGDHLMTDHKSFNLPKYINHKSNNSQVFVPSYHNEEYINHKLFNLPFIVPPRKYYNEKYRNLNAYTGCCMIDRTNTLKDCGYTNIVIEQSIPSELHSVGDFSSVCDNTAFDIVTQSNNKSIPIAVTYSGGLDSTAVICALLKQGADILVLGSNESIKENPKFYNDVLVNNKQVTLNIDNPLLFLNQHPNDYIYVTGECGAHIMGTTRFEESDDISDNTQIYHGISEDVKKYYFEVLDKCPVSIKTDYDARWWAIFALKWQFVKNRHHLWCGKICENLFNFYMTDEFQMWALNNDYSVKCPDFKWKNYKMPMRDYIYSYYPNRASSYDLPKRPSIELTYKHLNYNMSFILSNPKRIVRLDMISNPIQKQFVIHSNSI